MPMIATTISNSISEKPACTRREDFLRFINFKLLPWIKYLRSSGYFNRPFETMDYRAGSKYYYRGGGRESRAVRRPELCKSLASSVRPSVSGVYLAGFGINPRFCA